MRRVVHFEIHAHNPERAIRFYQDLFGWKFEKFAGSQDYWVISTGPKDQPGIDGGLIRRKGEIVGEGVIAYVCTVDVPSVEQAVADIVNHGGTVVVPKMPIPGVGWLVYGKDTEGNIFGVMQADPEVG